MPTSNPPYDAASGAAFFCAQPARWATLLLLAALAGCQQPPPDGTTPGEPLPPGSIGSVQGAGPRSAFEGRTVKLQGVVTGNFVSGLDGFYMQDATGAEDGDRATSDALFVSWKRGQLPKVRRGDRVEVLGKVTELGDDGRSLTALTGAQVEVLGRGAVKATVLTDAPAQLSGWEALEGMWLRINAPLMVSGNDNLRSFGELHTAFGSRLRMPTDLHAPGPKARALAEDNSRRSLLLDDARLSQYPDKLWFLPTLPSADAPFRAGSVILDAEGILDWRFGAWRLQLTEALGNIQQAPRPLPAELPTGLRLASANLHNLFNGNGRGGGFPTARGAASRQEYERQRDKLVAMLIALQPDIVALSEAENDARDGDRSALADLLSTLNRSLGEAGDYRAVDPVAAGDDLIRVAMIYRESRVAPAGAPASLLDGPFAHGSRAPLAQTFRLGDSGRRLTVVANHFKSKGGCEDVAADDPGNRDQNDGQGCWNAVRVESARALDLWLKSDPTGSGSGNTVLLGDFNAYTQDDPLRLLRSLGWRDPLATRNGDPGHHSFVYSGQVGSLDHALLSPGLVNAVVAGAVWQLNSDENEFFDYHHERPAKGAPASPYAASDHDPLVLVLDPSRAPQ